MTRIRLICAISIGLFALAAANGADEKQASDREQMYRRYLGISGLVKGGTVAPHWLSDGNRFWYVAESADGPIIYLVDPEKNSKRPLFDADRLRKTFTATSGKALPKKGLPFRNVEFVDGDLKVRFDFESKSWLLTLADYKLVEAPAAKKINDNWRTAHRGRAIQKA